MRSPSSPGSGPVVPVTMVPNLTPPPPPSAAPTVMNLVHVCQEEQRCKTTCDYGYKLGPLRGDGCRLCFCNERNDVKHANISTTHCIWEVNVVNTETLFNVIF